MRESILVIGDHESAPLEIRNAIAQTYPSVFSTASPPEGISVVEKEEPSVIVLTFQRVEDAETAYLKLYRQSTKIHQLPHNTIPLCSAGDAPKAYESCLQRLFDDYLVDKPLQDGQRLLWAIHQAIRAVHERHKKGPSGETRRALTTVEQALILVEDALKNGEGLRTDSVKFHEGIGKVIEEKVVGLADLLAQPEYADAAIVKDRGRLDASLERYASGDIRNAVINAGGELGRRIEAWRDQVASQRQILSDSRRGLGPTPGSGGKACVLVVEDNEEYCGTLVDMLEEQGYAVVATGDGIRALALLNRQTFDLILMDYQLPGMDGIETIRLAAQAHGANLPPVIMLTGFGTKGLVNASLEAGAVDYVIKPVRAEFLFQKIARHLAGPVSAVVVPPDGGTGE